MQRMMQYDIHKYTKVFIYLMTISIYYFTYRIYNNNFPLPQWNNRQWLGLRNQKTKSDL